MTRKQFLVKANGGLKGRNVELFTQTASKFTCKIDIESHGRDKVINAKSVMGVIAMLIEQGDEILIVAKGADEKEAIAALGEFLENEVLYN